MFIDPDGRDVMVFGNDLREVVNRYYRSSPTFRAVYDMARQNRNIMIQIRIAPSLTVKGSRGENKFGSYEFNASADKMQSVWHAKALSLVHNIGGVIAHEIFHVLEKKGVTSKEQLDEFKKRMQDAGVARPGHADGTQETDDALLIEAAVYNEDISDKYIIDIGNTDVTQTTFLDADGNSSESSGDKGTDEAKERVKKRLEAIETKVNELLKND